MSASQLPAEPVPAGAQATGTGDRAPVVETIEEPPARRRRKIVLLLLLSLLFLGLILLAIWYLLFRQPIVPIPTIPGQTVMPTYVTSIYGSKRPMGVAVTPSGDKIYVGATEGDTTARVFDASGKQLALMQPPVSTGADHAPVYLALDPTNGEVYVSDRLSGAIYVYDASGTYQRAFDTSAGKIVAPLGLAIDAAGNLYVTDVGRSPQRIVEFDRSGKVVRSLTGDDKMSFPNGIAVDKSGNVYVADSNNGRLLVIDATGAIVAKVGRGIGGGNLGLPRGVAIDAQDRVYVVDSSGQQVIVFGVHQPGQDHLPYLGSFGSEGVANGAFEYPNGGAVDSRGRIYVTDSANDRVQLWSY